MNLTTILFSLPNVTGMDFGERLSYSLRMLVVGMGVVFASLCILWAVLALFHRVYERVTSPEEESPDDAAQQPASVAVSAPETSAGATPATDDGALVAAITAAIMQERTKNGQSGAFRVVSFRRTKNQSDWNK